MWETTQEIKVHFWPKIRLSNTRFLFFLSSLFLHNPASFFLGWHLLQEIWQKKLVLMSLAYSQDKRNTFNRVSEELRCVANACTSFCPWAYWSVCAVGNGFMYWAFSLGVCVQVPSLCEDLLSSVDQPLKIARDKVVGKDYLLCDYNRDGDSYRSSL